MAWVVSATVVVGTAEAGQPAHKHADHWTAQSTFLVGEWASHQIAVRRLNPFSVPAKGCIRYEFDVANGFDRFPSVIARLVQTSASATGTATDCRPKPVPSRAADLAGYFSDIVAADLNGDDVDELIYASLADTSAVVGTGSIGIAWTNCGTGASRPGCVTEPWSTEAFAPGLSVSSLLVTDVDGDGLIDIVAGTWGAPAFDSDSHRHVTQSDSGSVAAGRVVVLFQKANPYLDGPGRPRVSFEDPMPIPGVTGATDLLALDEDRDGRTELLVVGERLTLLDTGRVPTDFRPRSSWGVDQASASSDKSSPVFLDADVAPNTRGPGWHIAATVGCIDRNCLQAHRIKQPVRILDTRAPYGWTMTGPPHTIPSVVKFIDLTPMDGSDDPTLLVGSTASLCALGRGQLRLGAWFCAGGQLWRTDSLTSVKWAPVILMPDAQSVAGFRWASDKPPRRYLPMTSDIVPVSGVAKITALGCTEHTTGSALQTPRTTIACEEFSGPWNTEHPTLTYVGGGTVIDVEKVLDTKTGSSVASEFIPGSATVILRDAVQPHDTVKVKWVVDPFPRLLITSQGTRTGANSMESPSLYVDTRSLPTPPRRPLAAAQSARPARRARATTTQEYNMVWSTPSKTPPTVTGFRDDIDATHFSLTAISDRAIPDGAKLYCVRRGSDDAKWPFEPLTFKIQPGEDGWEATATFDSTTLPSGTYVCVLGTFRHAFNESMIGIPRREKVGEYIEIPELDFIIP